MKEAAEEVEVKAAAAKAVYYVSYSGTSYASTAASTDSSVFVSAPTSTGSVVGVARRRGYILIIIMLLLLIQ